MELKLKIFINILLINDKETLAIINYSAQKKFTMIQKFKLVLGKIEEGTNGIKVCWYQRL